MNHKNANSDSSEDDLKLNYLPIRCPDTECLQIVFQTDLLSHFLNTHAQSTPHDICIAYDGERTIMKIDPRRIQLGRTAYYGALTYAGIRLADTERPHVFKPICAPNNMKRTSCDIYNLRHHLPVMIMITHTTWEILCKMNKTQRKLCKQNLEECQHIFVMWCFSADSSLQMNATLSVFDSSMLKSYSTVCTVRKCPDRFDVNEFAKKSSNCLRLTMGDIQSLFGSDENAILLEIILQAQVPVDE